MRTTKIAPIAIALLLAAAGSAQRPNAKRADVSGSRIIKADSEPGNWMSHGRTYDEQRFSPLKKINDTNVSQLGLAWSLPLDADHGLEATPLVVDGVMYTSSAWSIVYAVSASTGEMLWKFDPKVPRAMLAKACCGPPNRGVAVWEGKVFVGTLDGRLIALDANNGKVAWENQTTDKTKPFTITGAPRVVKGKVLIGNGGAEFGVRGYVTAYDANTGKQAWRFYTVPGDPAKGFENKAMERAAKTWNGRYWEVGGGGTVWDSMAYDPDLNQLYIGVGNGSPWNREVRSPGGGDNLYLSSIVALNPDNGDYIWHYQTTPGDSWDYTATQHMILADLPIHGTTRKVLMQAPKNGFFYVLDRKTGELLSATAYTAAMSWATGVDMKTGRPIETPNARYIKGPEVALPGPLGAHNWQPMSFSPLTKLVYIPALDLPFAYAQGPAFKYLKDRWNLAIDLPLTAAPDDPEGLKQLAGIIKGHLVAWDPVAQKPAWTVEHPYPWNGGVLSTAGNLVFQGTSAKEFVAYAADTGKKLWSFPTQVGIQATPIAFSANGEDYISIMTGWSGAAILVAGGAIAPPVDSKAHRVLTFKIGGKETLPVIRPVSQAFPQPPALTADAATVKKGKDLFHSYCKVCHGDSALGNGVVSDLRKIDAATHKNWDAIVLNGILKSAGMVSFKDVLNKQDADAIHAYVIKRANEDYAAANKK